MGSAVKMRTDYWAMRCGGWRREQRMCDSAGGLEGSAIAGGGGRDEPRGCRPDRRMDRHTLGDSVHRFNGQGPDGLRTSTTAGPY